MQKTKSLLFVGIFYLCGGRVGWWELHFWVHKSPFHLIGHLKMTDKLSPYVWQFKFDLFERFVNYIYKRMSTKLVPVKLSRPSRFSFWHEEIPKLQVNKSLASIWKIVCEDHVTTLYNKYCRISSWFNVTRNRMCESNHSYPIIPSQFLHNFEKFVQVEVLGSNTRSLVDWGASVVTKLVQLGNKPVSLLTLFFFFWRLVEITSLKV